MAWPVGVGRGEEGGLNELLNVQDWVGGWVGGWVGERLTMLA